MKIKDMIIGEIYGVSQGSTTPHNLIRCQLLQTWSRWAQVQDLEHKGRWYDHRNGKYSNGPRIIWVLPQQVVRLWRDNEPLAEQSWAEHERRREYYESIIATTIKVRNDLRDLGIGNGWREPDNEFEYDTSGRIVLSLEEAELLISMAKRGSRNKPITPA